MTEVTTLVKIKPEADTHVMAFYSEALKLKEYAESRSIIAVEDLAPATVDLSIIARVKKGMEGRRKDYLHPFQEHIKEVNEDYKRLMEPVETADRITREKILTFQLKQKLIREEQEKINALRMEAAKRDAILHNGEISESVNLVEVMPEAPRKTETDLGTAATFKIKKWEVEDLSKVPFDYLMIDAVKIGKVVRAGIPSISGIRIWEEESLRITTK